VLGFFKRVAAKIEEQRYAKLGEGFAPDFKGLASVFQKDGLPVIGTYGDDLAVVIHIHEISSWGLGGFAADVVELIGPIDVVLIGAAVELDSFFQLLDDLCVAA